MSDLARQQAFMFPLSGYIEMYLETLQAAARSPHTLSAYRYSLARFADWARSEGLGTLDAITPHTVRRYLRYLQEQELSSATVHAYALQLKIFVHWLVEEEILEADPLARVKLPRLGQRQKQPLAPEEQQALLDACRRDRSELGVRDTAIVLVLLDTGLRAAELLSMRRDAITPKGSLVVLGKGNKERTAQLEQHARRAVFRYLRLRDDEEPRLWVSRKGPLGNGGLKTMLARRSEEAGIRHVHPHLLRHTFSVEWIRSGGSAFALMQVLGHTTMRMTSRYVALSEMDIATMHRQFSPANKLKF